ncbi:hypothetical protein DRV84_06070 [Rhodosalinus sediminis]|uniref:PhoP regulatory network protein YrbL n=1 Tax=Rhodosalinus sediminis TaxID=1940533 RepID=A0A3D9BWG2_9RHOB|nr:YrbL family protein [Rhodosalinus sediminis]REC57736.1 hypothetical protein DRV84_06070 [Rhodosalinus sediminis]
MIDPVSRIDLTGHLPVAQGAERRVYLDPDRDDRVLKLIIPLAERKLNPRSMRGVTTRYFPSVLYRSTLAEQKEQARALCSWRDAWGRPPFALHFGFVPTSLGWGAVAQRVAAPDGGVGPTLLQLTRAGALDARVVELLNDTAARIARADLRASDLNAKNLVLGSRGGPEEVVLVDGFGDVHALPVRNWSRRANRTGLRHAFARIAGKLGLVWRDADWRFHLP